MTTVSFPKLISVSVNDIAVHFESMKSNNTDLQNGESELEQNDLFQDPN